MQQRVKQKQQSNVIPGAMEVEAGGWHFNAVIGVPRYLSTGKSILKPKAFITNFSLVIFLY